MKLIGARIWITLGALLSNRSMLMLKMQVPCLLVRPSHSMHCFHPQLWFSACCQDHSRGIRRRSVWILKHAAVLIFTYRCHACLLSVPSVTYVTLADRMTASAYLLSRFYTRAELVFRISLFVSAATLAGAIGGLMASGFLAIGYINETLNSWSVSFRV